MCDVRIMPSPLSPHVIIMYTTVNSTPPKTKSPGFVFFVCVFYTHTQKAQHTHETFLWMIKEFFLLLLYVADHLGKQDGPFGLTQLYIVSARRV